MRTAIILVALFAGVQALAQEESQITVKTSAVNKWCGNRHSPDGQNIL
jgi:hypothetical protein